MPCIINKLFMLRIQTVPWQKYAFGILLKSLILWEGYGDSNAARLELIWVMSMVPKKHDLHRMASQLLADIDQEISKLSY